MNPRYLLDTNVCIGLERGRDQGLRDSVALHPLGSLSICEIVWAELLVGTRLAANPAQARLKIEPFSQLTSFPFDRAAAEHYADIRVYLQRQGQLIGGNDLQIAAIALAHSLTLVTHNTREFARVPNLLLEDWQS
jgi:tRNA(fMet)-specific endonuclease VapC